MTDNDPRSEDGDGTQNSEIDIRLLKEVDEPLAEYANRLPNELKRAIEGIGGETQYAIIVLLIDKGPQSFTQLQNELGIHQQTLSNALEKLRRGNLVINKEYEDLSNQYKSRYSVSKFGKRFVESLVDSLSSRNNLMVHNEFTEASNIDGAVFGKYLSVERQSKARTPVQLTVADNNQPFEYAK